jgi:hypothetical protein
VLQDRQEKSEGQSPTSSQPHRGPQQGKSQDPTRYRTVLTLGSEWAYLFDKSLARQLTNVLHLDIGRADFILTDDMGAKLDTPPHKEDYEEFMKRLNSKSMQASEIVWRMRTYVELSDFVLIDTRMTDTGLGQLVLNHAVVFKKIPVWGVGTEAKMSPIAPAYLSGIVYPQTPDDLVKLVLSHT